MKKKMSKKQDTQSTHTDNRCIWMTAGVISYKLCPINYDCEHCELDKAMRSQVSSRKIRTKVEQHRPPSVKEPDKLSSPASDKKTPILFFTFSPGEVKEGLYLHPSHLWAQPLEGKKWRVGVDELLAYVLPQTTKLELSLVNDGLSQDQHFGKILTPAGTVFLISPLSGRFIQTNPGLAQHPELIQQEPYGEGWLATIEWNEERTEFQKFLTGTRAKNYLEEEAQHLNFLLRHRGVEVNQIGQTLPDGGINIRYLRQVLPSKVCLRLANELTVTGKQAW